MNVQEQIDGWIVSGGLAFADVVLLEEAALAQPDDVAGMVALIEYNEPLDLNESDKLATVRWAFDMLKALYAARAQGFVFEVSSDGRVLRVRDAAGVARYSQRARAKDQRGFSDPASCFQQAASLAGLVLSGQLQHMPGWR